MSHSRNKKRKKRKRSLQDNTSSLKLNSRLVDVHRNFLFTPPFFYPSLFLLPWEYQKKETEKKKKNKVHLPAEVLLLMESTRCAYTFRKLRTIFFPFVYFTVVAHDVSAGLEK